MKKVFLKSLISTIVICAVTSSSFTVNAAGKKLNDKKIIDNIETVTGTKDIVKSDKDNNVYLNEGIINIPKRGNEPITIKSTDGETIDLTVKLPLEASGDICTVSNNGTILYENNINNLANIALQPKNDGFKVLININDKSANKEYEFTFDLPQDSKLVSAASYLGKEYDTKEVFVVDKNNIITSIISPAWAKDANGKNVSTYYKIEGNTLIQVVNFNKNSAFPIVADPNWWKVTRCASAIAVVVGSVALPALKITKIKEYIKALGGVKEAAMLLTGATSAEEKGTAVVTTLAALAAEISGIGDIQDQCL